MLTSLETGGLAAILQLLSPENLLALAKTCTKNMVKFETHQEAMKAILAHTEKPSDLLRRQKITKQILFNYLRSVGTFVPPGLEKRDCCDACLELWQSQDRMKVGDIDEQDEYCGKSNLSSTVHAEQPAAPANQVCQSVCAVLPHEAVEKLSVQFLIWFFDSLHKLTNFGSHHFWPDCRFYICIKTPPNIVKEECLQNADSVAQAFCNFIIQDQLYFNPNISKEAIKCEQERHGLIKIAVGGVVHRNNNCIGVFDFFFGLVQDPKFNNNWKIKIVKLESQVGSHGCAMPNSSICTNSSSLPMIA